MKIRAVDYALVRFATLASPLLKQLGNWESAWLAPRLARQAITRPVFIAGLARSGTTVLLELLAGLGPFATHRYRDFPFVLTPYLWNRYLDLFPYNDQPAERAHKDRIFITRESPEGFEEPIWRAFFPVLQRGPAVAHLADPPHHAVFERFYRDHIKKILLLRGGSRYLSKNNYSLTRIGYLATRFPDAVFVVPVRHPVPQVLSLVRQHRLFLSYAQEDPRTARWLSAAGHNEFGPHRRPIAFNAEAARRACEAWCRGDDALGYAIQWAGAYRLVARLCDAGPEISRRLLVLRYEDLCQRPRATFESLLAQIELRHEALRPVALNHIAAPTWMAESFTPDLCQAIWHETEHVARRFGYSLSELQAL